MNKHSALARKVLAWRINLGFKILPPGMWKSGWKSSKLVQLTPIHPEPAPIQSESAIQQAAAQAWEKCATHPSSGEYARLFREALKPPASVARHTDAIVRQTPSERLDTLLPARLRQNTPIPDVSDLATFATPERIVREEAALQPTLHGEHEWYPSTPQPNTDAIARLPIANDTTPISPWQHQEEQHTGAFLLDNGHRDMLFEVEDVRVPSGPLDEDEMTIARREPGLYQIQMMARHKQRESE